MLPRHQLMLAVVPTSNLPLPTSQPFVSDNSEFGVRSSEFRVGMSSTRFAFPGSTGTGSRIAAATMKLESCGAGLRAAAINSAACSAVGLLYSSIERGINLIFAAAAVPSRSATWATNRLSGRTWSFELRQRPLPSNSPHEPNAQFWAPGGFSQEIFDASHCHRTELAADQPAPSPALPRFARLRPLPSIRTLS